jgi:hypothetical protein
MSFALTSFFFCGMLCGRNKAGWMDFNDFMYVDCNYYNVIGTSLTLTQYEVQHFLKNLLLAHFKPFTL